MAAPAEATMHGVLGASRATLSRPVLLALRPRASLALALALLALSVAALVVLAELLVTQWTDALLFLAWLLLWIEVFAATAVFDAWRRLHRWDARSVRSGPETRPRHAAVRPPVPGVARYGASTPYF